jgi:hypothetical protein
VTTNPKHQQALLVALVIGIAFPAAAQTPPPASTASQAAGSAERMAMQPLRDLNIVRDGVPPELTAIMEEPYSLKGLRGCADYKREIARMTTLVGPDVDSPEARAASGTSTEFVLGTAESVVASLVPGRGIIRRVSGAADAEKQAKAAALAGSLRRAFLKGRASGLNCKV